MEPIRAIPYVPRPPIFTGTLPPRSNRVPDFSQGIILASDLIAMDLPPRPALLGDWMKRGDFGYLFAPRGAGKSWMAMLIGNAVAKAESLGNWSAGEGCEKVVYFDAEMNLTDVRDRAIGLQIDSKYFRWLSNEALYLREGQGVNIANIAHQDALSDLIPNGGFFIIDNLSTAQIGMAENDNDSFDIIRDWILRLRHRGITVMIVHHAGRNGSMRGSSRREDMAHWIISLKEAVEETEGVTAFTTSFEKCRNCQGQIPLRWTLSVSPEGTHVQCQLHSGADALLTHIREGVSSATELAELLGVQKGTVSKWAKKLFAAGKIRKDGPHGGYLPAKE